MSLPFLFYKSKIRRKPLKIEDINFKKVRKKYPTRILKLMDDKKLLMSELHGAEDVAKQETLLGLLDWIF